MSRSTTSAPTWAVQPGHRRRIAPAQVGVDDLARQVVGKQPVAPHSMNDRPRSHANSSSPSSSPSAARSNAAVMNRACAASSSANRCRGLGTASTKLATSRPRTSGTAPSSRGTAAPSCGRCASTSSSSESASGWAMGELQHPACSSSATCARRRSTRASTGSRLRNDTTRSSSRQPGSSRHAPPGRSRPAITTSAPAGRAGRNSSRSQSSSPAAVSNVSSISTGRSRPPSAAAPASIPSCSRELRRERRRGRLDRPQIEQPGSCPTSRAASARTPSSVVLPTPPGPDIQSTLNGGSGASSAKRNSSSSAARPTNPRLRAPAGDRRRSRRPAARSSLARLSRTCVRPPGRA